MRNLDGGEKEEVGHHEPIVPIVDVQLGPRQGDDDKGGEVCC